MVDLFQFHFADEKIEGKSHGVNPDKLVFGALTLSQFAFLFRQQFRKLFPRMMGQVGRRPELLRRPHP